MEVTKMAELASDPSSNLKIVECEKNGLKKVGLTLSEDEARRLNCGHAIPVLWAEELSNENAEKIYSILTQSVSEGKSLSNGVDEYTKPEFVIDHLDVRALPAKRKIANATPIEVMSDIAFYLQCTFDHNGGSACFIVPDGLAQEMFEKYGRDTVIQKAMAALEDDENITIGHISNFVPDTSDCPILVVSNEDGNYGASAALFSKKVLRRCCHRFLSQNIMYLIPSSVHECLVINMDKVDNDLVLQIHKAVQETVDENDRLSDNVFIVTEDYSLMPVE